MKKVLKKEQKAVRVCPKCKSKLDKDAYYYSCPKCRRTVALNEFWVWL